MSQEFPNRLPELPIEKLQVREDEYMSEEFLMILFSTVFSIVFSNHILRFDQTNNIDIVSYSVSAGNMNFF